MESEPDPPFPPEPQPIVDNVVMQDIRLITDQNLPRSEIVSRLEELLAEVRVRVEDKKNVIESLQTDLENMRNIFDKLLNLENEKNKPKVNEEVKIT